MNFRFYKFTWLRFKNGNLLNSGQHFYYENSSYPYNLEKMEKEIKVLLKSNSAVIAIPNVSEISREEFELISGKPFHVID
ncbi:MAG: hypothetical protein ABIS74_20480 [Ferruginibacter sp.]